MTDSGRNHVSRVLEIEREILRSSLWVIEINKRRGRTSLRKKILNKENGMQRRETTERKNNNRIWQSLKSMGTIVQRPWKCSLFIDCYVTSISVWIEINEKHFCYWNFHCRYRQPHQRPSSPTTYCQVFPFGLLFWIIILNWFVFPRTPFQHLIRRLIVRTRKVSKPCDLYSELNDRFEMLPKCLSNFKAMQ